MRKRRGGRKGGKGGGRYGRSTHLESRGDGRRAIRTANWRGTLKVFVEEDLDEDDDEVGKNGARGLGASDFESSQRPRGRSGRSDSGTRRSAHRSPTIRRLERNIDGGGNGPQWTLANGALATAYSLSHTRETSARMCGQKKSGS